MNSRLALASIIASGLLWASAANPQAGQPVAAAQAPSDAGQAPVTTVTTETSETTLTLAAGAAIPLRFLSTVSSGTHARGQQFDLEVTDNINVGDVVVVPAGSIATGEVVHVDRARGLGKAGELIVAARFVTIGERRIKLRSQLSMTGQDKTMQALFLVPWVRGKNLELPLDTEVIARTVIDEKFVVSIHQ
jgi:hypothetical protein